MKNFFLILVSFSILFSDIGITYADDQTEIGTFTKIGPQVFATSSLTATTGTNSNGTPLMYVILHGTPTVLAVVNLDTIAVQETFILSNSTSASGLKVDSNNVVWIGGTNAGHLYSYDPNTNLLEDHGLVLSDKKDTAILDIEVANNMVFGGSAYGGSIFSYSTNTEKVRNYNQLKTGKEFTKSVGYFEKNERLFIGIGSNAELVELNTATGNVTDSILPKQYKDEKYITDIDFAGDYLFAKMYPSKKIAIFNAVNKKYIDELKVDSQGISPLSTTENMIFYTYNGALYSYDLETNKQKRLSGTLPKGTSAISLNFVTLNDPLWPGDTLVGLIDNKGSYFKYNVTSQSFEVNTMDLPGQPITLYSMLADKEGKKIYTNGYMSGGLGVYDVDTGATTDFKGVSQLESLAILGDKMYLGGYPKARILEYDLSLPWDNSNPRELYRLENVGQERPTAMVAVEEVNKVFIGTFPDTSNKGGVLSVYDPSNEEMKVYKNYIIDQSIISLTYSNGYIYGGTSIFANQKVSKYAAKLFRFPVDKPNKKEIIPLPIDANLITGMITGPDETIWGMADGTLFVYDPQTHSYRCTEILDKISGRFMNAKILIGKDGFVYSTLEGMLLKINPDTLQYTVLKDKDAYDLAQDYQGNLYFRNQADLWKYTLKKNK